MLPRIEFGTLVALSILHLLIQQNGPHQRKEERQRISEEKNLGLNSSLIRQGEKPYGHCDRCRSALIFLFCVGHVG